MYKPNYNYIWNNLLPCCFIPFHTTDELFSLSCQAGFTVPGQSNVTCPGRATRQHSPRSRARRRRRETRRGSRLSPAPPGQFARREITLGRRGEAGPPPPDYNRLALVRIWMTVTAPILVTSTTHWPRVTLPMCPMSQPKKFPSTNVDLTRWRIK